MKAHGCVFLELPAKLSARKLQLQCSLYTYKNLLFGKHILQGQADSNTEQPLLLVGMIPREKFLSTMPQVSSVSKWDHKSCLQQMGRGDSIEEKKLYIIENITPGVEIWVWEPFSSEGFTASYL